MDWIQNEDQKRIKYGPNQAMAQIMIGPKKGKRGHMQYLLKRDGFEGKIDFGMAFNEGGPCWL